MSNLMKTPPKKPSNNTIAISIHSPCNMQAHIQAVIGQQIDSARAVFGQYNAFETIRIEGFNCADLTPPEETNGRDLPKRILETFFQKLHALDATDGNINNFPCLYVFELADPEDADRTWQCFKTLAGNNTTNRNLPAFKKGDKKSPVLYVGKADRGVGGRLVTHMGYLDKPGNHGLQLAFWAREMNPPLLLNVTVLRFKQAFRPYLVVFEKQLAKDLQPIVGKH